MGHNKTNTISEIKNIYGPRTYFNKLFINSFNGKLH